METILMLRENGLFYINFCRGIADVFRYFTGLFNENS